MRPISFNQYGHNRRVSEQFSPRTTFWKATAFFDFKIGYFSLTDRSGPVYLKIFRATIKGLRMSWTFSVLRPKYYLRPFLYFDLSISTSLPTSLFRPFSNFHLLVVEKNKEKQ